MLLSATVSAPRQKKFSPYLFTHHSNVLTFRIRIPSDLQACLGKTEYRRSLGRCYAAEAKQRALRLATAAFEVFSFAREAVRHRGEQLGTTKAPRTFEAARWSTPRPVKMEKTLVAHTQTNLQYGSTDSLCGRPLSTLTDSDIRAIAQDWLLAALKGANLFSLQAAYASGKNPQTLSVPVEYQSVTDTAAMAERKVAYQDALKACRVDKAAKNTDTLLTAHGIRCDQKTESAKAFEAAPPNASIPYLRACQELMKASTTFYSIMEQTSQGNYFLFDAAVKRLEGIQERTTRERVWKKKAAAAEKERQQCPPPPSLPVGITLSEALALFFEEKKREGRWNARTQVKEQDKYLLFQAIISPDGSLPVASIGADHMRRYKKIMFGMPKNRTQSPKYKSTSLSDLIQKADDGTIPEADRIAPRTIENHTTQVAGFINWAAQNEYHSNPRITGLLHIVQSKQDHENRDPYNRDDLIKIFNPKTFLNAGLATGRAARKKNKSEYAAPDSANRPSRFWIPLLGLFTGARLEELAQLDLRDIVAVDREGNSRELFSCAPGEPQPPSSGKLLEEVQNREETLCIFIRADEGQSIKNPGSKRYVPLSKILTEGLNFLDYLSLVHSRYAECNGRESTARKENNTMRIFPELTKTSAKDSYANAVSNWYRRYRQTIGIVKGRDGGRKDFHSFRDTVAHWCDQIGTVNEKPAARYLGHTYRSMTFGTYSKDTAPHILYETITAPFTEYARTFLDVEGLKASRWAVCTSSPVGE